MLAMELEDIEREIINKLLKFDGLLIKYQIRLYFSKSINCAIQYIHKDI